MANIKEQVLPEVGRIRRKALSKSDRLSVKDQDPNYRYRVVNVDGNRVEEFIERGYEIVHTKIGDGRVDAATPLGSQFTVGPTLKAVVMRQRKDWYEEDQAIKQADIDEKENAMNADAKKGF